MYDNLNQWGPRMWRDLHRKTLAYPDCPRERDKSRMLYLFYNLPYDLPCPACATHLQELLEEYPLTDIILSSRKRLVYWLIDIHNMVNVSLGKPKLSYEYAIALQLDEC